MIEKEKTMIIIIKKKGNSTITEMLGDDLMPSLIQFVWDKIYQYLPR